MGESGSEVRGRCWYCGYEPEELPDLTVDHAVPISRDGSNEDWNLLPACLRIL